MRNLIYTSGEMVQHYVVGVGKVDVNPTDTQPTYDRTGMRYENLLEGAAADDHPLKSSWNSVSLGRWPIWSFRGQRSYDREMNNWPSLRT